MFKFTRMTWVFFIVAILLYSTPCLALVMTSGKGMWPANWPKELEPYRENAKTIMVATGIQEDIHEIRFENREDFEKVWPTILKLKSKGAPLRLCSIEPFKSGRLFNNEKPVVRIYGPAYSSVVIQPGGKILQPGGMILQPVPPWPESIKSPTGELPEYVTKSENGRG